MGKYKYRIVEQQFDCIYFQTVLSLNNRKMRSDLYLTNEDEKQQ